MSEAERTCPAVGCSVKIPRTQLMCRHHWRLVPRHLQVRIWAAHKEKAWDEWRKAAKEALVAVALKERRKPSGGPSDGSPGC